MIENLSLKMPVCQLRQHVNKGIHLIKIPAFLATLNNAITTLCYMRN